MLPLAFVGTTELLIVALVIILLFGARKLPEIAKGLAESITAFRRGLNTDKNKETEEKPELPIEKK
jgi:sec-independent protein translocase protein TatA